MSGHHYYLDVPSPKFSSNRGGDDNIDEDEEKNEIIRCIMHNDYTTLNDILSLC